jgi:PAS domain S-box-containing protein
LPEGAEPDGADRMDLSIGELARVLDALPEAVIVARIRDGLIRYSNAALDRQLGVEPGALVGTLALDIAHTDPMAIEDLVDTLLVDQEVRGGSGALRRADGGIMRTMFSSSAIEIDGQPHGISTIIDPDRLKGELLQSAREANARMHTMMDEAPVTVSIKDLAGRYVFVNRRFLTDSGWDSSQVLGRSLHDLIDDADCEAVDEADVQVLEGHEPVVLETRMPFRDGSHHTYLCTKFPLWGRRERIVGICAMSIDITAERLAQQALAESDSRLRELAESVDEAFILLADDPFQVLYHSPNFEAVTGLDLATLAVDPASFLELVHADDRARAAREMRGSVGGGLVDTETSTTEFRVQGVDGRTRWLRIRSRRLTGGPGPGLGHIGTIVADITADRAIEAELERARDLAQQANQRKNEFLSSMSHELRTPLNAILGFSQLLEMDRLTLNAHQRDAISHIRRAGDHLLELINEVLDIARIESGEMRLSFESIDIAPVVAEALDLLRAMADERRVDIEVTPPLVSPLGVKADRQRLRQVLINLMSNAIKYNDVGGRVTVAWGRSDDDRVELVVHDTGSGISPDDIDRLFRPFERLENSTGIEGTGIGLTLTRQLVEAMGGSITVESHVGDGSTFTVSLHAAEPGLADDATRSARPSARSGGDDRQPSTRTWTILYVEDNAANIELVERTLARLTDVRTRVALRGDEALELLARERVDLLLLDLHLPDMLGDALLAQVRRDPELADIPVLVISADATPARINRLLSAGAAGYLTKPFELRRLLDLVRTLLPDLTDAPLD